MKNLIYIIVIGLLTGISSGCTDFLDAKPNKAIVVPDSLEDINAILNNFGYFNREQLIGLVSSDDFQTTGDYLETIAPQFKNAYLWERDLYPPDVSNTSFALHYRQILYSNVILDLLDDIISEQETKDHYRGQALFFRAYAYYALAQLYLPLPASPEMDQVTIPVKMVSDISAQAEFKNAKEVYDLILKDMNESLALLPKTSAYPIRPTLQAAYGFLARVYLQLGNFQLAKDHAELALADNNILMNFSDLDAEKMYPMALFNKETIFYCQMISSFGVTSSEFSLVNNKLYEQYHENDLRKTLYFTPNGNGDAMFRGSYVGNFDLFSGIALDEIFLIAAEANVRLGMVDQGLELLYSLLKTRYVEGKLLPYENLDQNAALNLILLERRKELVFRGIRWSDQKRLNMEPETSMTVEREVNGVVNILSPNSPNYVFYTPARERLFQ
ncbi:RagB/SusD family nutrient uptake outer membrane protein [Rhodonellum sp.]|uniref:RagB/SusD family nutrient uptake outer membrane protein n=1 Tax=Rhodonellum sp. TaxID=2231180 RepID=UPI00271C799E|nr:RagB/SusD family nutrient uptake outer membrane protein [Rhodonellum sp.]MDO9553272.1 RagB/SusD family nutrient uptake outer membrane protein [Rhodonellum sp.]